MANMSGRRPAPVAILARGRYYGYPPCCVRYFALIRLAGADPRGYGRNVKFPLDGSGYIPCPTCEATYTDEELIARIAEYRLSPHPFPEGDVDDDNLDEDVVRAVRALDHETDRWRMEWMLLEPRVLDESATAPA